MAVEPGDSAEGGGAATATATANGHGEHAGAAGAAADANHVKKNKADKKKEKRQKYKQNKQQRRQQQQQQPEQPAAPQGEPDVVVEYVAAPAPDIEELIQAALPGGSGSSDPYPGPPPAAAADADADGEQAAAAMDADGAADGEEGGGYGGLGLGATAGLGSSSSAGLGGLGFRKASEPSTSAAVDPEAVMEQFKRVLERFMPQQDGATGEEGDEDAAADAAAAAGGGGEAGGEAAAASDADSDEEGEVGGDKLSKKQRKLLSRLKIAELKQQCLRPDVVEVWDVTAQDPQTLVAIKALRNTVPVPRHWSQKRAYLQGKRGIEKPPFKLPEFIEATGITEMRNAYMEKEEAKKLKQKQRDRMSAKTGKMDIAYEVLYDAFFKHQRKPKMTGLGELYYEGKEYEAQLEHLKPGVLSGELREALGMEDNSPPPWLVNMQRYGPPPSYPNLKVAGLNAPIPPGAQFGYQPGGWGKPPVDAQGNPLYGDVFGLAMDDEDSDAEVDKVSHWGVVEELEESEEEESEEEEDEEEEGLPDEGDIMAGIATDATGISSLQSGLETPDVALNLRKQGDSIAGTESAQHPQLYTVLEQRKASVGGGLMGTDHVYVMPGGGEAGAGGTDTAGGAASRVRRPGGAAAAGGADVEVTLSPEELEGLDNEGIRALYESKVAAAKAAAPGREDFSDMVAAHNVARKRKDQKIADAKAAKKQKESFKF